MLDEQLVLWEPGHAGDPWLVNWWTQLHTNGDMNKLCTENLSLSEFFTRMTERGVKVVFAGDEEQCPWFAGVIEPFLDAALVSVWVRPKDRRKKAALRAFVNFLNYVFAVHESVFGVTKQEKLVSLHERLGYTVLAREIPGLCGGENGTLMLLTREAFEEVNHVRRRQTEEQRQSATRH